MEFKINAPLLQKDREYNLAYHIGAQSTQKFTIRITDQLNNVLVETSHENGGYEPCVDMNIISIPRDTTLSIAVEYEQGTLTPHSHHNFTKNGISELYALYLADEDLNFHALTMHFVFSQK